MKEQLEKEKMVLDYFMEHPTSYIREIAEETKISKSSVQRYLQKYSKVRLQNGVTIAEQLKENQDNGRKKGGLTYFQNNTPTRGEKGRFTGSSIELTEEDKVEAKKQDIIFLCNYYLDHYPITFQKMAEELDSLGLFTKDYIYHCITSPDIEEILGEELSEEIYQRLDSARFSFDKKIGSRQEDIPVTLSPAEDMVVGLRRKNHSQEEVGRILGVSRGTVQKWEKKAIEKMKDVKK